MSDPRYDSYRKDDPLNPLPENTERKEAQDPVKTAWKTIGILLLCAGVMLAARDTTAGGGPVLLFEDSFDGTALDSAKWAPCPDWVRQDGLSVWDKRLVHLNGEGQLVLRAEWDEAAGRVRAGAVRTMGLFSAGYGYYEALIRFPSAPGIWGAFWMMCGDVSHEGNGARDGVEIDIIETIANERGASNSALHWDGYAGAHQSLTSGEYGFDIYDGRFHTFGLDRTSEGYRFYVDGVLAWQVMDGRCSPCPENGYMKLTLESAAWAGGGTDACKLVLPAEMQVDYVRVYSSRPE